MPSTPRFPVPSEPTPSGQTVVRASTIEDLVGVVPHLLGFVPRESLVVGFLVGARMRVHLTARFDLPTGDFPGDAREIAQRVGELARKVRAAAAFLIVMTDAPPGTAHGVVVLPFARLSEQVERRLARQHCGIVGNALVTGGRLWHYDGSGPEAGVPLPSQPSGAALAVAAEQALQGERLFGSREELAASVQAQHRVEPAALRAGLERGGDAVAELMASGGWQAVATAAREEVLVAAGSAAIGQLPFALEAATFVLVAIRDPWVRDAVLTLAAEAVPELCPDPGGTPAEWSGPAGSPHPLEVDSRTPAVAIDAPALVAACIDLVAWARDGDVAEACALLGGIAYAVHRAPLAGVAVERALDVKADHSLALLLRAVNDAAVHPAQFRKTLRQVDSVLDLPVLRSPGEEEGRPTDDAVA